MYSVPQVTVIIPAYNVSSYIKETLISLQQQSLRLFEAIVVDDGSIDISQSVEAARIPQLSVQLTPIAARLFYPWAELNKK